jgi:hypothetical protein
MHLNGRYHERIIRLSSGWEVEALFEGREWDGEKREMTREVGKGQRREANHRLEFHQEVVVAGLRLSSWEF